MQHYWDQLIREIFPIATSVLLPTPHQLTNVGSADNNEFISLVGSQGPPHRPAMNPGGSETSGGLVRRVKTRDPTTDAASGSGSDRRENGGSGRRSDDDDDDDQEDYVVDNDSKETRLTLMEEVLLLGLKEKEVGCCCDSILSSSTKFITSFNSIVVGRGRVYIILLYCE